MPRDLRVRDYTQNNHHERFIRNYGNGPYLMIEQNFSLDEDDPVWDEVLLLGHEQLKKLHSLIGAALIKRGLNRA